MNDKNFISCYICKTIKHIILILFLSVTMLQTINSQNTSYFINTGSKITTVASNHLYIEGILQNSDTGIINNNGQIHITGNLTNSGTFNSGDSSNIIFCGTTDQVVTDSSTFKFSNIELNKAFSQQTISLQYQASISGTATFTKGYLNTTSANLLTFKNNSIATGANDSSFVRGPVKKIGNTAFIFPIGKDTNYQSLGISAPTDTADSYTAEYFDTTQTLGTATDPTFSYISTCEYFNLDRTTGTSQVVATLGWDLSSCVANMYPDPRVIGWDGTKWKDYGMYNFTYSPFGGTISTDGALTQYGALTLGNNPDNFTSPSDTADVPSSFRFIKNNGQLIATNDSLRPDIKYYIRNTYPETYFTDSTLYYVFSKIDTSAATTDTLFRIDLDYIGTNNTYPVAQKSDSSYANYFLAHCPSGITNVPQYERLNYGSIYPHVDLIYSGDNSGLIMRYIVRPGAKPEVIRAKYTGADSVKIITGGKLCIYSPLGNIVYEAPTAFNLDSSSNFINVSCQWVVQNDSIATFNFPNGSNYNLPLCIRVNKGYTALDITDNGNLEWSTYYGGSSSSQKALDSYIDDQNNLLICGRTFSSNFPISSGAIQLTYGGSEDAVILKFNALRGLDWATFYGGASEDEAYGITSDELYNVYFTGRTQSTNFPVCSNCSGFYQPSLKGNNDAFIVKLNPYGTTPQLWATYFGGNAFDGGYAISYKNPYLYIVGKSITDPIPFNLDFPVKSVSGAYNQLEHGDKNNTESRSDVFIAKFTTDGNQVWSTFLGGEGWDSPTGCAVDNNGNLFVTGTSENIGCLTCTPVSGKFPLCDPGGGAYVHANAGEEDAFISKFDITGALIWSSEYGEWHHDNNPYSALSTNCITIDVNDNIYITGSTTSWVFPVLPKNGAYNQELPNSGYVDWTEIFISKFSSNGNLLWSTLWGGYYNDIATAIEADPIYNRIYITGYTYSETLMPLQQFNGLQNYYWQPNLAGFWDGFLIVLNENDNLEWATYLGGGDQDFVHSISVSPQLSGNTNIILAGGSSSANYPVCDILGTNDYFEDNLNGTMDITISEFALLPGATGVIEKNAIEDLKVYPNPSTGNITISISPYQNKHIEINIYDAIGKMAYSQKLNIVNENITVNISFLPNGVYIMKVKIEAVI